MNISVAGICRYLTRAWQWRQVTACSLLGALAFFGVSRAPGTPADIDGLRLYLNLDSLYWNSSFNR